ncbi:MAG: LysE family translocator [Pseudomonadales bacterium]|nr:LysE family translocator [Pseudomonadales bacterium]
MNSTTWLLLGLTLFAGAASPGPSLALVVRSALTGGRVAGLLVALAHGIGVWLYALAVVFGVATALVHVASLMLVVQLVGVLFLMYLGTQMIRGGLAANHDSPDALTTQVAARAHGRYVTDGFLIVFLNPKIMVFFLAVFSQFLTPEQSPQTQVAAATLAGLIDGLWYGLVATLVSLGRFGAFLQRHSGKIDLLFGGVLWVISLWIVFRLNAAGLTV